MNAGTALARALCANVAHCGARATVVELTSKSWASITFSGERHRLLLAIDDGEAARRFLDGIEEREFELRGHVLADIAPVSTEHMDETVRVALEALTVELF